MRIIGGIWKGRSIEVPQGRTTTRPTTDRNREAIVSAILSQCKLNLAGAQVLDGFAGSGALGFELLSRGAAHATFVEKDRFVARLIRTNARELEAQAQTTICQGDLFRLVQAGHLKGAPFDIVFLDPPYSMEVSSIAALIDALIEQRLVVPGALIVYERATSSEQPFCKQARMVVEKAYKTTTVDMFCCEGVL